MAYLKGVPPTGNNVKGRICSDTDGNVKATTALAFDRLVCQMGWSGTTQFEEDTGVKAEELIGQYFTVIHDRIYMKAGEKEK